MHYSGIPSVIQLVRFHPIPPIAATLLPQCYPSSGDTMPTVELNGRTAPALSARPDRQKQSTGLTTWPGFGLRCRASGARSWFVQYRTKAGETRKHTLGDPQTVPFSKARHEAGRLIAAAKLGGDPAADARKAKDAITVSKLIDSYQAHQKLRMKPRSYEELSRHLGMHAKPLHSRRASQVAQRDVVGLLQGLAATSPVTANRVRASLSAMFAWGMKAGLVSGNPIAATFKPAEERPRERVLTDDELALIWSCTAGGADYDRIVRLLLLTGARREEIAGMGWSELIRRDSGSVTWVLPAERSKNHLPHELALPPDGRGASTGAARRRGRRAAGTDVRGGDGAILRLVPVQRTSRRTYCQGEWTEGNTGLGAA